MEEKPKIIIESIKELKSTPAWKIVIDMAEEVITEFCDLENIDENLPAEEYKIEHLSRRKARQIINQIFNDIKYKKANSIKDKINYE